MALLNVIKTILVLLIASLLVTAIWLSAGSRIETGWLLFGLFNMFVLLVLPLSILTLIYMTIFLFMPSRQARSGRILILTACVVILLFFSYLFLIYDYRNFISFSAREISITCDRSAGFRLALQTFLPYCILTSFLYDHFAYKDQLKK